MRSLRVVIGTAGGQSILLSDVAQVRREAAERETLSLVNGNEAVEIAVLRESTANIVALSRVVRDRLTQIEGELPAGIRTTLISDQATFIESAVGDVGQAAVLGGMFAMLVLLLFLRHLPTTLIVVTAIPISVVATFVLMFSRDITLNIMSLGGLALGIGMLVDSAIVVLESIARERDQGLRPRRCGPPRHLGCGHRRRGLDPDHRGRLSADRVRGRDRRAVVR
jgi:hydrophobic/amphiphilic exporter-1 (mainly G- bacteria), HAE1 family